jgi:hypothetical protein
MMIPAIAPPMDPRMIAHGVPASPLLSRSLESCEGLEVSVSLAEGTAAVVFVGMVVLAVTKVLGPEDEERAGEVRLVKVGVGGKERLRVAEAGGSEVVAKLGAAAAASAASNRAAGLSALDSRQSQLRCTHCPIFAIRKVVSRLLPERSRV